MTNEINEKTDNEYNVIEELHKGREKLLQKFDGNLRALFDDAKHRDALSKEKLVNRESSSNPDGSNQTKAS